MNIKKEKLIKKMKLLLQIKMKIIQLKILIKKYYF